MRTENAIVPAPVAAAAVPAAPRIYRLRHPTASGASKALSWRSSPGVDVILGGGDVGKSTISTRSACCFSPSNSIDLVGDRLLPRATSTRRLRDRGRSSLPPESGINYQFKPSWPWEWNGTEAVVPSARRRRGVRRNRSTCCACAARRPELSTRSCSPTARPLPCRRCAARSALSASAATTATTATCASFRVPRSTDCSRTRASLA